MAYFANGSEGMFFDEQCMNCKYGQEPCPIAFAQLECNYEAANNETATKILDILIDNKEGCMMYNRFKDDFEIPKYKRLQGELF